MLAKTLGPKGGGLARGVNDVEPYMKGFHNILSRPFFEGVGLIKKQNQGWLMGRVCATAALN